MRRASRSNHLEWRMATASTRRSFCAGEPFKRRRDVRRRRRRSSGRSALPARVDACAARNGVPLQPTCRRPRPSRDGQTDGWVGPAIGARGRGHALGRGRLRITDDRGGLSDASGSACSIARNAGVRYAPLKRRPISHSRQRPRGSTEGTHRHRAPGADRPAPARTAHAGNSNKQTNNILVAAGERKRWRHIRLK